MKKTIELLAVVGGLLALIIVLTLASRAKPDPHTAPWHPREANPNAECDRLADKIIAHQQLTAFEESMLKYCK